MEAVRDRIGRYHVLGRLAQGGMAEVYKVKTVGLAGFEKIQALKRILPHQAKEPRFIRSFVDEARIAVELSHRTIVQVFDFGEADGELYLAMELIEGKDLRTALAEAATHHLPLPATLAAYLIAEVGTGLDYAHRKRDQTGRALGIVHCDVSPANVMISTEGYIKILDFGVARASFASAVERRRLRGKPRYMAPEQTRGETPTPATDVFALGIVAWELLTGAPLFDGPDLPSILAAVRRADVPPVEKLAPDVPEALAAAVTAALQPDPAARGTAIGLATAAAATAAGAGPRAMAAWLDELARRVAAAPAPEPRAERASVRAIAQTSSMSSLHSVSAAGSADVTGDTIDRAPLTAAAARRPLPLPLSEHDEPPETETSVARVPRGLIASLRMQEVPTFEATSTGAIVDGQSEPTRFEPPSFAWEGMDDPAPHMSSSPTNADALAGAPPVEWLGIDAMLPDPWASESTSIGIGHLEAIDEPPESAAPITLAEHRRAVVVAMVIDAPAVWVAPLAATLGELAYKRGGLVVADDPVVAFGLEVAGEDDAATAMAFALDAQLAAREARIAVRIGGRAGVSVGGGTRPRVPQDAIDEARALARDAQPERPLFAGAAGRLSSAAFALRERPAPRRLHRRLRVVEVLGPRSFDERGRQLERRGKFVGRAGELAELEEAYELARTLGTRRCALLVGAAGTGKSRVVAELVARVSTSGAHVVAASAGPGAQLLPYALYTDVIDALLDLPPARGQDARARARTRLERLLERAGHAPAAVMSAGDAWRTAMELRDGAALLPVAPAELRAQLASCLTAVAAAERPGRTRVVVIEDLHCADTASVAVLRDWIFSAPDRGELVLATSRPDHASFPSDLVVELDDLAGDELRALCADRLADAASPAAIAAVIARAGGNPLFVEELAAAIGEAGGADVPQSARDVIAARVARLPPSAKAVVQYAAVAGDGVRASILEELVGAGDLVAELDELRAEGLLLPAGDSAEVALVFARGLVREVVYESLSTRARRDAHLRIGRLYAARFHQGREEPPTIVADHLERGGDGAGAAAFWLRAARLASGAGDRDAAVALWNRVIALEAQLGGEPATTASWARRWEARLGREAAMRERGDAIARAEDLAELDRLAGNDLSRKHEVAERRAIPTPVSVDQVVAIQPPPTTRSPS